MRTVCLTIFSLLLLTAPAWAFGFPTVPTNCVAAPPYTLYITPSNCPIPPMSYPYPGELTLAINRQMNVLLFPSTPGISQSLWTTPPSEVENVTSSYYSNDTGAITVSYVSLDSASFTRNSGFVFASLTGSLGRPAVTAISPYQWPWGYYDHATFITPRHCIMAAHYVGGPFIRVVDANGHPFDTVIVAQTVLTYNPASQMNMGLLINGDYYDICISQVADDITQSRTVISGTNSWTFAGADFLPVLPISTSSWFADPAITYTSSIHNYSTTMIPYLPPIASIEFIGGDSRYNYQSASVHDAINSLGHNLDSYYLGHTSLDQQRFSWGIDVYGGDSGNPICFALNGKMVMVSHMTSFSMGSYYYLVYDAMNAELTRLQTVAGTHDNYQLSPVDLSGFAKVQP